MGRERRRRNRRAGRPGASAPATPPGAEASPDTAPAPRAARANAPAAPVQVRSDRVIERESTMMMHELRRVLYVSIVCFGMLGVLVVVDRLQ